MNQNNPNISPFRFLFLFCLCIIVFSANAGAQNLKVSGLVVDQAGQPLPGVYVLIKDSQSGTITGSDGLYTLEGVPGNAVLVYSFIGFIPQEVPVDGRMLIDIVLEEEIQAISEIVINAGYYPVKERERTGNIAKITAKEIENQPVSNVLSAMQGRMLVYLLLRIQDFPGAGFK